MKRWHLIGGILPLLLLKAIAWGESTNTIKNGIAPSVNGKVIAQFSQYVYR